MSSSLMDTSNANVIQTVNTELQNDGHLIFIVHGFSNNGQEEWVANLRRSIFDRYDNKTIIVGVVYWGWGMYHNAYKIQNLAFIEILFSCKYSPCCRSQQNLWLSNLNRKIFRTGFCLSSSFSKSAWIWT